MAREGPVVLGVVGDTFTQPARVLAVIWEGATSSGDTAEVRSRSGNLLWAGRTQGGGGAGAMQNGGVNSQVGAVLAGATGGSR